MKASLFGLALAATLGIAVLAGCSQDQGSQTGSTSSASSTTAGADTTKAPDTASSDTAKPADTSAPSKTADAAAGDKPKDGDDVAVLDTADGQIVFAFLPAVAPKTVDNFKGLAAKGFYDGTRFHRCIEGFMIQGGDPKSKDLGKSEEWGTGGSDTPVPDEFNATHHVRGIVSMANSGGPNSQSSQFFIVQKDNEGALDGKYSAFGRVVTGMDVVDKIITTGDAANNGKVEPDKAVVVKSIKIEKWPVK